MKSFRIGLFIVALIIVLAFVSSAIAQTNRDQYDIPSQAELSTLDFIEYEINVPYSVGVYDFDDDLYHQAVGVPKLPKSVGRLRLLEMDIQEYNFWFMQTENTGTNWPDAIGNPTFVEWNWSMVSQTFVAAPNGTVLFSHGQGWDLPTWLLGTFDGVIDFFGGSGRSEAAVATSHEEPIALGGRQLVQFTGRGNALLDVVRSGSYGYDATTANARAGVGYASALKIIVREYYQPQTGDVQP